jgi:hypothetical protein
MSQDTSPSQVAIMRAVDVAIAWTAFAANSIDHAMAYAVCASFELLLTMRCLSILAYAPISWHIMSVARKNSLVKVKCVALQHEPQKPVFWRVQVHWEDRA